MIETEDVVEWVAKAAERGEQLLKARPNLSLGTGESSFCHDDLRALLDTIERLREENARVTSDCRFLLSCIDQSNEAGAPVDESDPEDIATIDQIRAALNQQ